MSHPCISHPANYRTLHHHRYLYNCGSRYCKVSTYVDFAMLLHRAKFSEVSEVPVSSYRPPTIKRITSFDAWMQAWNLYFAVILAHNPSRAVELFGYQRLICSAHILLPLESWLQYDYQFWTLAAADPLLRWDQ